MSKKIKERYQLIDALRGLSILLMCAHHFGYTCIYFGYEIGEISNYPFIRYFLSPLFAGVFILLSGMSSRFSRSNIKRGLITLIFAALVTAVSYFFGVTIYFGILHFLGLSMLIYGLISKWLNKISLFPLIAVFSVLFVFSFAFLPIYTADNNIFLWFGFLKSGTPMDDYFPFGRWFALFLLGTQLGQLVIDNKFPRWFYSFKMPFLPAVGRRTLIIFLLHQPFFYLILTIYSNIIKPS